MARKSKAQLLKLFVLTVGVADGLGIYLAHSRLNQPVVEKDTDDTFVLATSAGTNGLNDPKTMPDQLGNVAVAEPKVESRIEAPKVHTPKELAQIELPLPPMSPEAGASKRATGNSSTRELASIGLPLPFRSPDIAQNRRAVRILSAREGAQSDLPPMGSNPNALDGRARAERPAVVPSVRNRGTGVSGQEAQRPVAFQSHLDLLQAHLVSQLRTPAAKASIARSPSGLAASTRRVSTRASAHQAQRTRQTFSAIFADVVGNVEPTEVGYGQQSEVQLNQSVASESAPVVVGNVEFASPGEQASEQSVANQVEAPAQQALKLPLPAPDTDSSPPRL